MPVGKVSGYSPDLRLETPRLNLRRVEEKDLPNVHALQSAKYVEESDAIVYPEHYLQVKFEKWQEEAKSRNLGMFVVEEKATGDFVGTMGIESSPYEAVGSGHPLEFTFARVKEEYMSKGYFQEATAAVLIHAYQEPSVDELLFLTLNPKCCHIANKYGFTKVKEVDVTSPFWTKSESCRVNMYMLNREKFLQLKAEAEKKPKL